MVNDISSVINGDYLPHKENQHKSKLLFDVLFLSIGSKETKILPWGFEKSPEFRWDEPCPCVLLAC